jgi:nucleoside-diphosphate-sugar epimerase
MNIFVTGATGVLGKPVVRLLVEAGHQVYALSRSQANRETIQQLGAEPITTDLFDRAALIQALEATKAEAIIHLATRIPPTSQMGKLASWQENDHIRRDGTRTLVDAALHVGEVQTLIYPSFYYVYPDRSDQWIDAISTPVQSQATQQATIEAEAEVARFTKEQRCGIVLRLGSLYGPEVPSALEQFHMAQKGFAVLPGAPDAYLSYIWADDAARAIVVALAEAPSGVYDIVDDEPLPRAAFANALAQSVGKRRLLRIPNSIIKLMAGSMAQVTSRSQRVSNRRFRELTTWKPTVTSAQQGWSLVAQTVNQPERTPTNA